jgi:hypothetical protein
LSFCNYFRWFSPLGAAQAVDNPTNARGPTIAQNPHICGDAVNPRISTGAGRFFPPVLPHSISLFAAARQ